MNLVDSSGWLEYFTDAPNAEFFAGAIQDTEQLIVPSLAILEVFKRTLQQRGEDDALSAAAVMRQGQVVELDFTLALSAARLGVVHRLALADSVIYATAVRFQAVLWTQDADFRGLAGVQFRAKSPDTRV